jgi:hypothetical protein
MPKALRRFGAIDNNEAKVLIKGMPPGKYKE